MGYLNWISGFWGDKKSEVVPIDETPEEKTKREQRAIERGAKRQEKRDFKIEKIKAITAKALAVGTKRKWLVFMIVSAIAAYLIFKGGLGGVPEIIKGFF